jgi:hypothetical protein
MNLKIVRKKETLIVSDLVLEHNHTLHLPATLHLMASQRKISELQAFEIETADNAGIGPKAAHELASRQVGAFCPFFSEASNSSGTQAQAQVSFTQMLMVICS